MTLRFPLVLFFFGSWNGFVGYSTLALSVKRVLLITHLHLIFLVWTLSLACLISYIIGFLILLVI